MATRKKNQNNKVPYYSAYLTLDPSMIPEGSELAGARGVKAAENIIKELVREYTRDGKVKFLEPALAGNGASIREIISNDEDALNYVLKAAKDSIAAEVGARLPDGVLDLEETAQEKQYDAYTSELFSKSKRNKTQYAEMKKLVNALHGKIEEKGRLTTVMLPEGAMMPEGKSAIKSIRATSGNIARRERKLFGAAGLDFDKYINGTPLERQAMEKALTAYQTLQTQANPEVARRRAKASVEETRARRKASDEIIDEAIASGEEEVDLPQGMFSRASMRGKAKLKNFRRRQQLKLEEEGFGYEDFELRMLERGRKPGYWEKFVEEHPDSPEAQKYLERKQKVNTREEKKRLAEAMQTPGTPEFDEAINKRMNKREATRKSMIKWAKKNRKSPLAKAILKSTTKTGKTLTKARSFALGLVQAVAVAAILTAVNVIRKVIFDYLPAMAKSLFEIAHKGERLNMTDNVLREYARIEKLGGMGEGTIANFYGSLRAKLNSVVTNPSGLESSIGGVAVLASREGSDLIKRIVGHDIGDDRDLGGIGKELADLTFKAAAKGITGNARASGNFKEDWSTNIAEIGQVFGGDAQNFIEGLKYLFSDHGLTAQQQSTIKKVALANESDVFDINGQEVHGGSFYDALVATLGQGKDVITEKYTATPTEYKAAQKTGETWSELSQTWKDIKDSIFTQLLATTESIAVLVRSILKGFMLWWDKDKYASVIRGMDEQDYYKNVANREVIQEQIDNSNFFIRTYMKKLGIADDEEMSILKRRFKNREGVPSRFTEQASDYIALMQEAIKLEDVLIPTKTMLDFNIDLMDKGEAINPETRKKVEYKPGEENMVPYTSVEQVETISRNATLPYLRDYAETADMLINLSPEEYDAKKLAIMERLKNAERAYINANGDLRLDEEVTTFITGSIDWELREARREAARFTNAEAFLSNLNKDKQLFGKPLKKGQEDIAQRGETRVFDDIATRRNQATSATMNNVLDAIRTQFGNVMYNNVLSGQIVISGTIKSQDRTTTILLKDKDTGKELGKVNDVQNSAAVDWNFQNLSVGDMLTSIGTKKIPKP